MLRRFLSRSRKTYRAYRAQRLAHKEKVLLQKKEDGKLKNFSVMKNVSIHSVINAVDGEHLLFFCRQ